MKIRSDFVTNSSSTAYIITNISNVPLTLVDFVEENWILLEFFKREYSYGDADKRNLTQDKMLECAKNRDQTFYPNEKTLAVYGDEDGDILGRVYDYILRDGGRSKNFEWKFKEYYR